MVYFEPYGVLFWLCLALIAGNVIVLTLLFRKKPYAVRRRAVLILCLANIVLYLVYKASLPFNAQYVALYYGEESFTYWSELPLFPCTFAIVALPFAFPREKDSPLFSKIKNALIGICVAGGTFGAVFTFFSPAGEMLEIPFFTMVCIGYYGEHILLMICAFLLLTLGIYKPHFRELPVHLLCGVALILLMHGINLALVTSGVAPKANYFFTMSDGDAELMAFFQSFFPSPLLAILTVAMMLYTAIDIVLIAVTNVARTLFGKNKELRGDSMEGRSGVRAGDSG